MTPTINDHGICLVNRLYRHAFPLKRNDIIAFNVGNQISIKRIYGLPGETITLNNGDLYINDIKIEKNEYINSLSSNIEQNVKLANDEYYVLGDNPDSSKDSRFLDVGNIKKQDIVGKVWYIVKK